MTRNYNCVVYLQVMDIILHCVDQSHLKSKGLNEVFPAICRYNQVSHCPATRRIAGMKNYDTHFFRLIFGENIMQTPTNVHLYLTYM